MSEIERAIKDFEKFKQAGYTHSELPSSWHIELAISSLREKQEREKGCEYCNSAESMAYGQDSLSRRAYIYLDGNLLTADLYSDSMAAAICFCPMCGRPLTKPKGEAE